MTVEARVRKTLGWNLSAMLRHLSRAIAYTPAKYDASEAGPIPAKARKQLIEMVHHANAVLNRQPKRK